MTDADWRALRLSYDPQVATATTPSSQNDAGASKASLSEVQPSNRRKEPNRLRKNSNLEL